MKLKDKIQSLQNETKHKITYDIVGEALGITRAAVGNRILRNQELKDYEEKLLDEFILENVYKNFTHKNTNVSTPLIDRIEINYWEELPEELRNPKIASVWFDKEIVENAWGMSADHLCIIPMIGDKMTRYWYPIRSGDILIIDTSQDYIMGNGVYFATSQNNTRFWIREMQMLINQEIEFKGYAPSGETTKVFTKEQLDDVDFRLIGKVIKNVSFRL